MLFPFALSGLGFYGLILGGWASGNKYSLLGAARTAAQLVSYEVAMGLSVVGVVMMAQSLSLVDIVNAQADFGLVHPVAAGGLRDLRDVAVAETNRALLRPAGGRVELVGGYHTEYGGLKFAMFFLAEYVNMIIISAFGATPSSAGSRSRRCPAGSGSRSRSRRCCSSSSGCATPRLRYDRLMKFGWKVLLPLATLEPGRHGGRRRPRVRGLGTRTCRSRTRPRASLATFRTMLKRPETIGYPERKTPVFPRFRGRHRLWRHENGLEKCVGCSLCVAACPADCIRVVAAEENTAWSTASPRASGTRGSTRSTWPAASSAATTTAPVRRHRRWRTSEMSERTRAELIYDKEMLLAPHPKPVPVRAEVP